MKAWKALLLAAPLLLTAVNAVAETIVTRCYAAHFVRGFGNNELRFTIIVFNNGDLVNSAVIQRFTVFDEDGDVIHDSGPKIGVAHPLNLGTKDITEVPPGGTYTLSTTDIWGLNGIPSLSRPLQFLSVRVEATKSENPALFVVHGRDQARDRVQNLNGSYSLGNERSANETKCFPVKS